MNKPKAYEEGDNASPVCDEPEKGKLKGKTFAWRMSVPDTVILTTKETFTCTDGCSMNIEPPKHLYIEGYTQETTPEAKAAQVQNQVQKMVSEQLPEEESFSYVSPCARHIFFCDIE